MVQPPAFREGNKTVVNGENLQAVNCEQVWREMSNYLEGEVAPALRTAMEQHFRGCERCTSVLEGTRNVIRLYGDERMMEAPTGFGRRLEKRLAQNARASGSRWLTWEAWLIPVAALALIAGGLRLMDSRTGGQQIKSEQAKMEYDIPPDLVVVVAAGTKVFHVPGCSFIHDKDKLRTLTAKEALKEGYAPCSRCLRKYLKTANGTQANADLDADDAQSNDAHNNDVHSNSE
jgi:hypothetical protein